mmetsp:Transcript_15872/g.20848  ORF Transcript_15872/g.20848 Transcript_15872/m.20848 type:complete len:314 (+) Transcript_15872:681-1622(+)
MIASYDKALDTMVVDPPTKTQDEAIEAVRPFHRDEDRWLLCAADAAGVIDPDGRDLLVKIRQSDRFVLDGFFLSRKEQQLTKRAQELARRAEKIAQSIQGEAEKRAAKRAREESKQLAAVRNGRDLFDIQKDYDEVKRKHEEEEAKLKEINERIKLATDHFRRAKEKDKGPGRDKVVARPAHDFINKKSPGAKPSSNLALNKPAARGESKTKKVVRSIKPFDAYIAEKKPEILARLSNTSFLDDDDDDDEEMAQTDINNIPVEQRPVPAAVFGNVGQEHSAAVQAALSPPSTEQPPLGALARFRQQQRKSTSN